MILHSALDCAELRKKLRSGQLKLAGNVSLKIYGLLDCSSGKRMKRGNRVFFIDEADAKLNGFRPCGHCLSAQYKQWKTEQETG